MYNDYGVGTDLERGRFDRIHDCIHNLFLAFLEHTSAIRSPNSSVRNYQRVLSV